MQLNIQNGDLQDIMVLLEGLTLKGKDSRARTRMIKTFEKSYLEFYTDEKTLLAEHKMVDDGGNIISQDEMDRRKSEVILFQIEQKELYAEYVLVESGSNESYFKHMIKVLDEYDGEFNGRPAYLYDLLLTELESQNEDVPTVVHEGELL